MMFNFFSDLKKGEYSFKDFKSFCDKIKVTFKMRHQKKIVIKAYNLYVKGLNEYDKIVSYGIDLIEDAERIGNKIDEKGKAYVTRCMHNEFRDSFIQSGDLKRTRESDLTLSINKNVKRIMDWDFK